MFVNEGSMAAVWCVGTEKTGQSIHTVQGVVLTHVNGGEKLKERHLLFILQPCDEFDQVVIST